MHRGDEALAYHVQVGGTWAIPQHSLARERAAFILTPSCVSLGQTMLRHLTGKGHGGEYRVMISSTSRKGARYVFLSTADAATRDRPYRPTGFGWRLVAANNRPIARSEQLFASLTDCRAAADQLLQRLGEVKTTAIVDPGTGRWSWRVGLSGAVVARSVSSYGRRIECVRALDQFLELARSADPGEGEIRELGARATRGYTIGPDDMWFAVAGSNAARKQRTR